MEKRPGDWPQTFTGKQFWTLDPKKEEIDIKDIAHSLAFQCRFNGHCEKFYSIAQHSILVSKIVPKKFALAGLLHDASETYTGNIVRPLKTFIVNFKEIELEVEKTIFEKFNVKEIDHIEIKKADNIALVTEMRDLMKEPPEKWNEDGLFETCSEKIIPLNPEEAEKEFLKEFEKLTNKEQ